MNEFIINTTDFEVNEKSSISYTVVENKTLVTIEIYGSDKKYDSLLNDEESEWSWTSYAPHFYFRSVPIDDENDFDIELNNELLEEFELGLYMMEHCDVLGKMRCKNGVLKLNGIVALFGENTNLSITIDASNT